MGQHAHMNPDLRTCCVFALCSALGFVATGWTPARAADDARQLVSMPEPARARLREEMLGNLRALQDIVESLAKGNVREAGAVAERELGTAAMGRNRALPLEARPGAHMPAAMHELGQQGHQAASAFARAAASGDRDRALMALPAVTGSCVACHHSYRVR